jgi:cephalosporin-C deacetylase
VAYFDLGKAELEAYDPRLPEPPGFGEFWEATLAAAREAAGPPRFEPVDTGYETVDTFDVDFSGYAGQSIKAWLVLPRSRTGRLPCVVEFIGYGGGRGLATEWLTWASAGKAHFIMDTRGQGSVWSHGDTPDLQDLPGGPETPGFMTRGIQDKRSYYYRRVFTDAVRAVETAAAHPAVDPGRLAVTGGSQGGGIAIAAAGLLPGLVKVAMPDVPFLCHFRRAVELVDSEPYGELRRWCLIHRDEAERAWQTLAYFDGVQFARRARAQALFSVALMDTICPPSTVYAAFNAWGGGKDIRVWPFNQHEGGGSFQTREKLQFLKSAL